MHVGVLPQVDAGEIKPEHVDRAAQVAQPPARQHFGAVDRKRAMQRLEVCQQFGGTAVWRRLADRVALRLELIELPRRRSVPRIDAGDGPAIAFVDAPLGTIGRALSERFQVFGMTDAAGVE